MRSYRFSQYLAHTAIVITALALVRSAFGSPLLWAEVTAAVTVGVVIFLSFRWHAADSVGRLALGSGLVIALVALPILIGLLWTSGHVAHVQQKRAVAVAEAIERAQPILKAVNEHKRIRGKYPDKLEKLVPDFLARIPELPSIAEKEWRYDVTDDDGCGGWRLYLDVKREFNASWFSFGDVLVYHPSGKYPEVGYGGGLIPEGKWGYYVE